MADNNINEKTLIYDDMITSYPKKRLIGILVVMAVMLVVVVICILNKMWIYAAGMILFMIYVPFITFAQSKKDYRFDFVKGKGLRDFKFYYKDKEVKLDYRLDRHGRFMWEDNRKPINNIGYADGSRMNLYITRYRIMNYVNCVMEQNNLKAENTY